MEYENINYDLGTIGTQYILKYVNPQDYLEISTDHVDDEKSFIEFIIKLSISKKLNDIQAPTIDWKPQKTFDFIVSLVCAFSDTTNIIINNNSWNQLATNFKKAASIDNNMYDILSYGIEHMFMTANSVELNSYKVKDKKSFIEYLTNLAVSKKLNDMGYQTINWSYDDTTQFITNMVTAFEHRFQHEHIDNPWEKIAEIMETAAILE